MNNNIIIVIYVRTNNNRDTVSIESQQYECFEIARKIFGHNVTFEMYIDKGVAGRRFERQNFHRMLNDIETGKIKAVITYTISRISRSLANSLAIVEQFDKSNVQFITVKQGEYRSASSKPLFNILKVVRQYQAEDIKNKYRQRMKQKR